MVGPLRRAAKQALQTHALLIRLTAQTYMTMAAIAMMICVTVIAYHNTQMRMHADSYRGHYTTTIRLFPYTPPLAVAIVHLFDAA